SNCIAQVGDNNTDNNTDNNAGSNKNSNDNNLVQDELVKSQAIAVDRSTPTTETKESLEHNSQSNIQPSEARTSSPCSNSSPMSSLTSTSPVSKALHELKRCTGIRKEDSIDIISTEQLLLEIHAIEELEKTIEEKQRMGSNITSTTITTKK